MNAHTPLAMMLRHVFLSLFLLSPPLAGQTIQTYAGGGAGDGHPATSVDLSDPFGLARDAGGNLYVVEQGANRVRRIDAATGTITTVAGNGGRGFAGDGGPATAAVLDSPAGVAVDLDGNLVIGDAGNGRVRLVDSITGLITTLAGGGSPADGLGDGGPATAASLGAPRGIALDRNGDLYIADSAYNRNHIRKVSRATGIITTIAGSVGSLGGFSGDGGPAAAAKMSSPFAVVVDASLNVYIADSGNGRIRRVDGATKVITTIAGNGTTDFAGDGGPATSASLFTPLGIALDASGRSVLVSDTFHGRVRKVDADSGLITTIVGNGDYGGGDGLPATQAGLIEPRGLVVDPAGALIIVTAGMIRRVAPDTTIISTIAGGGSFVGDDGPATAAILRTPNGVAVDSKGDLFVADLLDRRVRRVSAATRIITTYAGNGDYYFNGGDVPATGTSVGFPRGLALDAADNLYVADPFNDRVYRVERATGILRLIAGGGSPADGLGDGGAATAAALTPWGVAVDSAGNVFIADRAHHRIRRVEAQTGTIRTIAGIDGTGTDGGFAGDGGPAVAARLASPHSLAFDASGDLTFSDYGNNAVRKITMSSGVIQTIAGRGNPADGIGDGDLATAAFLRGPLGIAFDASGNLLIAESNKVRKVDARTKVITTVVGEGTPGFLGDGGSPRAALLNSPIGVAVDAAGNIFIGDSENHRIRIVPVNGGCPIPSIFSQTASQTIVAGQATVLGVFANGTGTVTYQWYQGAAGDVSRPVAGAVSASFTTAPLTQTTSFWVRVKDGCGQVDSTTVTVTVSNNLADLSLVMSASANPVAVGTPLTFTLTARNNGPTTATGVTVTDTLPSGAAFGSVQISQGTCSGTTPVVCTIGSLVPGAAVTILLALTPGQIGVFTNRARVAGNEPDPNLDDNTAAVDVSVSEATAADLGVGQSSLPDPVRVGQPLTYTLFVDNAGPAPATGIVLTDTLPSNVRLDSVVPQLGTCTGTTTLVCALGSLPSGGSTTVTVVVTPLVVGSLTNEVRIAAAEQDPTSYNNDSTSETNVLSNTAACPAPAPTILSFPEGIVRAGDTFTISWSDVYGPTDPNGVYRVQLGTASDFGAGTIVTETTTRNLVTSFPTQPGTNATLFFRITSVAGCGQPGGQSVPITINVAPNPPSIIVTQEQQPEWVVPPNAAPPSGTLRFKNVGGAAVPVQFRASGGFFTFSPTTTVLQAGQEIVVSVTALAGTTANTGTAYGSLSADTVQGSVSESVVLSVTDTSTPDGRADVDQDEILIRIPSLLTSARARALRRADPLPTVTVSNNGKAPIFLVPDVGPGGAWLRLDPTDFATPLLSGATRTIRLATDPTRITAADYPLPIWTVLTISAAGGFVKTQVKIFYGDTPAVLPGKGRGFLSSGTSSFIVPTAVHKEGAGGTTFTSDGWLRNLSPNPVAFDLFVTPSGQDGQLFATRVQQTIPGFATVRLFDFIQGLFGSTDLAGPVEIRSSDFSQLSVRINASGLPGNGDISSRYGTEIPVYGSGTGTGTGLPPLVLTGVKSNAAFRLNLILTETVGTSATVTLKLFDSGGTVLATKQVAVPAAGNTQFALLDTLGLSGSEVEACSLSVEPAGGSGRVVAIGTLIDNASSSFQSLSGRALRPEVLAQAASKTAGTVSRLALDAVPRVIPSIVHSKGIGAYFTTEVSITNATATPAPLHLVYDYVGSDGAGNPMAGSATADITLGGRASLAAVKSRDAIVNLFGLPADSNTAGPMRMEGEGVNRIVARATVTTPVDLADPTKGLKGSEFQSYSALSAEAVGLARTPVVTYPGIQKYPGIRTNLILAEVAGKPASIRIRVVDGTSGGVLAQVDKDLAPFERRQVNDIWNGSGGFDLGSASFDRIAISLEPIGSGAGSVVGALSIIDNLTNSSRILIMAPPGPPQPPWIGF